MSAMLNRDTCSNTCPDLPLFLFDILALGVSWLNRSSSCASLCRDYPVGWGALRKSQDKKPGWDEKCISLLVDSALELHIFMLHPALPGHSCTAHAACSSRLELKSERGNQGVRFFLTLPSTNLLFLTVVLFFFLSSKHTWDIVSASASVSLQFFLPIEPIPTCSWVMLGKHTPLSFSCVLKAECWKGLRLRTGSREQSIYQNTCFDLFYILGFLVNFL